MSLLQTAREASGSIHAKIEQTPLANDLVNGRVERPTYCTLLHALAQVHDRVEGRFHRKMFAPVMSPTLRRLHLLRGDIAALGEACVEVDFFAIDIWENELEGTASDWAWLGALYVLEGSRMGSRMLLRPIASALGVPTQPGQGVDYHLAAIGTAGQSWGILKAFLETAMPAELDRAAFAQGVRSTFQMLHDVYVDVAVPVVMS